VRRRLRSLALILAAGLLLSACSGDDDGGSTIGGEQDEATERTEDSQGATSNDSEDEDEGDSEPDPTMIPDDPDDIDEAYAQAVIDEIESYYLEALKLTRGAAPLPDRTPPVELVAAVNETFHPDWRENMVATEVDTFSDPAWSEEYSELFVDASEFEPGRAVVVDVEVPRDRCVLVEVERDVSGTLQDPPGEPFRQGIVLVPREEAAEGLNPTPWQFAVPQVPLDHQPEFFNEDACDAE
jgi:hypothetical protein